MAEISLHAYLDYLEDRLSRDAYSEVIAHCRHILEIYPKHLDTYKLLARALAAQDEQQDALDLFQRVLSSDPNDFIAHIGMSDAYRESNALAQAIWHLERAFEQVPNNLDLQEEIRKLYEQRGERAPRKIHLTSGALARMYLKGKLFDQAIAEIRAGISKDPERLDLQVLLAEALWASHQEVNAGKVAAEILKRLPHSIDANRILAQLWLKYNRPVEARPFLERVGEMDPALRYRLEHQGQEPTGDAFRLTMLEFRPEQVAAQAGAADWVSQIGAIEKQKGVTGPLEMPRSTSITDIFTKPTAEPSASTPAEEMPDWLQSAISGEAASSTPAAPSPAMPASAGEEEPDWLKEALGKDSAPAAAAPTTPAGDDQAPAWLQDALGKPSAPPSPAEPAAPSSSAPAISAGDDAPDWLQDALGKPASPTSSAASAPAPIGSTPEDTPDWLQEALTGGPPLTEPPILPSMEAPAEPAASAPISSDVPEWLADIRSEERRTPTAADLPISVDDSEVPSWLNDILSDRPAAGTAPATARPAAPEPADVVSDDWLDSFLAGGPPVTVSGAPQESSRPDTEEMPAPFSSEAPKETPAGLETWDDVPVADWLNQSAPAETPSASIEEEEAIPEWLSSAPKPETQPMQESPAAEEDEELPAWLAGAVSSSTTEEDRPDTAQDEVPSWLRGSQVPEAPAAAQPIAEPEDEALPDWLMGSPEVQSGLGEAPAPREEADSALPDWLSSAPGTTVPESSRTEPIASAEDEELPAWLAGVDQEEEEAATPAAVVEPAASDEGLPDWLSGGTSDVDEGEEDWLSQLTVGKPTPSEPAPAAAQSDAEPDWLSDLTGSTAEAEPAAEADDLDWLTRAEPAKAEVANGEAEEPDWMSQLDMGAPSEPAAEPASSEIPDWMKSEDEEEAEEAEADWMSRLEPEAPAQSQTPATTGVSLPSWLDEEDGDEDIGDEDTADAGVAAEPAQTDWLTTAMAPTRALPHLDDDEILTPHKDKDLFVDSEAPDWLSMMGGSSEEEAPEQRPGGQEEPEPTTAEMPALEEETNVAPNEEPMGDEIPSWMLEGDLDSDDAVKWLEEIAAKYDPTFGKEGEGEATATPEPAAAQAEAPEAEEEAPSIMAEEADDAMPSWLRSDEEAEELPSWLRSDEEETPAAVPAASVGQNGSEELSWLDAQVTEQGVSTTDVISQALTPDHPPVAAPPPRPPDSEAEPVSDDDLPEWLRGEDIEGEMQKAGPSSEFSDLPDLDVEDEELAWLDSALKAEEGAGALDADFEKLLAEADEEEALPSWLTGEEEKAEAPAMAAPTTAATSAALDEDEDEEPLPSWLTDSEPAGTAEAQSAVVMTEPTREPEAPEPEPVRMEAPIPVPADDEALPAWLSGTGEAVDTGLDEFLKATVPAAPTASKEPATEAPAAPAAPKPAPLPMTGPLTQPPAAAPTPAPAAAGAPAGEGLNGARAKMTDGYPTDALNAYEDLVQAGQSLDDTIMDLSEYVKGRRVDPRAYRIIGDAMMAQGRLQDALDMYRRALDQY